MSSGSVTFLLQDFIGGDEDAARKLWERYFTNLARLAHKKLQDAPRRVADEEDVALNAFASFWRRAKDGNFAQLEDRNDLWQLLAVITTRKAIDQIHHQNAQKRGSGKVQGESAFVNPAGERRDGLEQILGVEPTPELAAEAAEQCHRLLDLLDDSGLQEICLLKMERYTNDEIAEKLNCTRRTVQRRVQLIQRTWERELDS